MMVRRGGSLERLGARVFAIGRDQKTSEVSRSDYEWRFIGSEYPCTMNTRRISTCHRAMRFKVT
jgi:hypothetical protein